MVKQLNSLINSINMKKEYVKPNVKVFEIETLTMLASSGVPVGGGGEAYGKEAGGNDLWPEY